jgi:hypothetical protein
MTMRTITIIGSILCAISRLLIPGHELSINGTIEVLEHFWVIGLITAAVYITITVETTKQFVWKTFLLSYPMVCLYILTVFEIAMFTMLMLSK